MVQIPLKPEGTEGVERRRMTRQHKSEGVREEKNLKYQNVFRCTR